MSGEDSYKRVQVVWKCGSNVEQQKHYCVENVVFSENYISLHYENGDCDTFVAENVIKVEKTV